MLEYVFFDDAQQGRFTALLSDLQIPWRERADNLAGRIVSVPEDLPDAVLDELHALYDEAMALQGARAEQDETLVVRRVVGIRIALADGSERTVRLDGATGNLLLQHFTPQEAQQLVQAIARSLEQPIDAPPCRRE